MNILDTFYYLHIGALIFFIGTIFFLRKPSVFHPHILFVVIVSVFFLSDFLVRGYDNDNFRTINSESLILNQFLILVFLMLIVTYSFIFSRNKSIDLKQIKDFNKISSKTKIRMLIIAYIILFLDTYKRLYFSDFNLSSAIVNSFLPYGSVPWNSSDGFLGDSKFGLNLIRTALPISGLFLALVAYESKNIFFKLLNTILYIIVILFQLGEGARTPMVATLIFPCIAIFFKLKSSIKKISILLMGIAAIAITTSFAIKYRAYGLYDVLVEKKYDGEIDTESSFEYHQDDNYYQLIRVMDVSDSGVKHWDALYFFSVIVVNPIPRYFWSGKPFLLQEFYGLYKYEWATISCVGEFIAMFGVFFGVISSAFLFFGIIHFMNNITVLLFKTGGLFLYCILVLYCYMIFRSLLNITQYMYLPLIAYIAVKFLNFKLE